MSFGRVRWSVLILIGFLVVSVAHAQIRSATITGLVTDASGSVVPGAVVVVTDQETGISNTTKTTEAGQYTVPYLSAGTYTVAVTSAGFATHRQTGLGLSTGQAARVDVALKVATIGTTVEVAAQSTQIQTESSTVQGSISSRVIDLLPNPTSNPLYYAFLQAGVVPRVQTADSTGINSFGVGVDGRRQFSAVGVNGGRAWTNDIQLDGLPVMGGGYNEASVTPNTEGLEEVRVISNNFSAQYGRGQAILSMSTKSGTSAFHGEASYTLRNEALMANTRANKANNSTTAPLGIPRPPFKVNELGGSIGGPIVKNKLFFFSSYHYLRFNRGSTSLSTVPTALERLGNFSQTLTRDEAGNGVASHIFDPYNVVQLGPDLFQRIEIPNADLSGYPGSQYARKWFSFYPEPNRASSDPIFVTNNYGKALVSMLRRHNLNNRIDYRLGSHSIYGSFGLTKSANITPRAFGKAPLNDAQTEQTDKNPYGQIGDTIVVSPTVVLDMRYGLSRIQTKNFSGNKSGFTAADYTAFGVPQNLFPLMQIFGAAPVIAPGTFTALSGGTFGTKREQQSSHSFSASVTKIRGAWTHKFGMEARNLQSNYSDLEEASVQYPSTWFDVGGNFNFQYVTAAGNSASQNTINIQRGVAAARAFLGTPGWWIRPGANVTPAFSQKYGAVYTQNDWRATNKLTLNLGLRWDLQPGPTERYNRMSSVDLTATNPFGSRGAIVFPGVNGYSRNLWDTTYTDIGPRFGAAYQVDPNTVLRGGLGVTYLPSNSGYFSGPTDYGSSSFSSGTMQQPYGPTPNGVPVLRMTDSVPLNMATGANPAVPALYGISEAKFDRFFKNGRALQYNFFIERRFAGNWFGSVGYSASKSDRLMNRGFAINSNQLLPADTLAAWRDSYIASNMVTNPASLMVTNPFQPVGGPLRSFAGALGGATIAQQSTLYPYPLLAGLGRSQSKAWAGYNSLQVRASHQFSNGFHIDLNYTWSKEIDNSDNMEDNQLGNPGGTATGLDVKNLKNNLHLGGSDIPHRLTGTFLVDLPFGAGKPLDVGNKVVRFIVSGWQTGTTLVLQQGMPIFISGATSGALIAHPDRIAGVPLEVPKELQHWYDGVQSVTLPNGRVIKPSKNTFLKYYSGAFSGRIVTLPNGKPQADQNWVGTVCNTLNEMRGPGRFNIDMSLRRNIRILEKYTLEMSAEATNLLNSSQMSGSYSGALGTTVVTANAALGLVPGMGSSDTYGTIGTATFNPREVVLNLKFRF
jgi:trimeric autotransporter adhesin